MSRVLKTAVIGLGVGEAHAKACLSHQGCKLVAVSDFHESKASQFQNQHRELRFYSDSLKLIENEDLDLLVIASFDNHHHKEIIAGLNSNTHIFVEKPICLFPEEALDIRKALEERPELRLSSNLILRKSPRFQEIRSRVQAGEAGELFHLEGDYLYGRLHKLTEGWRGDIPYYSVFFGGGLHVLDLLCWIGNLQVKEVFATGNQLSTKNSKFQFSDTTTALLSFEGGATGKVSANFSCVHPHFHRLSLFGTEATILNELQNPQIIRSRNREEAAEPLSSPYPGVEKGALLEDFIDAILENKEFELEKDEVFSSMSVCFAVEESIRSKKPVMVEYL